VVESSYRGDQGASTKVHKGSGEWRHRKTCFRCNDCQVLHKETIKDPVEGKGCHSYLQIEDLLKGALSASEKLGPFCSSAKVGKSSEGPNGLARVTLPPNLLLPPAYRLQSFLKPSTGSRQLC
jgi:hypothetical protein